MSKLMCRVMNKLTPYNMARVAHNLGMKRTSAKILESTFGKQIGRTSESGLRGFGGIWSDGTYRIEVIDKDFNRRGNTIIERQKNGVLNRVRRTLFKNGKTTETTMCKATNPITMHGAPKKDALFMHFIDEHGNGVQQRSGSWSISLPDGKIDIHRNQNHILDYLIK